MTIGMDDFHSTSFPLSFRDDSMRDLVLAIVRFPLLEWEKGRNAVKEATRILAFRTDKRMAFSRTVIPDLIRNPGQGHKTGCQRTLA
jgi:hypothetical protein